MAMVVSPPANPSGQVLLRIGGWNGQIHRQGMDAFGQFFGKTGVHRTLLGDPAFARECLGDDAHQEMGLPPFPPPRMTVMLVAFVDHLQKLWPKGRIQLRFYSQLHRHLSVNPVFVFCHSPAFG